VEAALFEVNSGNREQGLADAAAAIKLAPHRDTQQMAGSLGRLGLARAYSLQGRHQSQGHVSGFPGAVDPDTPMLQQAKAEYAKLL
jgi:hypothetical protein